jgi:hypothetical protein
MRAALEGGEVAKPASSHAAIRDPIDAGPGVDIDCSITPAAGFAESSSFAADDIKPAIKNAD